MKITVPWMDLIRSQLKLLEETTAEDDSRDLEVINVFLAPIIAYGEQVEKNINDKGGCDISHVHIQ